MAWDDWKKSAKYTSALRVGIINGKEESELEIKHPDDSFLPYVIVQIGVAKDAVTKVKLGKG